MELIDAQSGHAKRHRNIAETPLALAYFRGQLEGPSDSTRGINAEDRYTAGKRFETWWRLRERSGINVLEAIAGSVDPHWWNDRKARGSLLVEAVRQKMYSRNYLVVQRFCGEGHSMVDSLRGLVDTHPSATAFRIREALDDLVEAMVGRRQPYPQNKAALSKALSTTEAGANHGRG